MARLIIKKSSSSVSRNCSWRATRSSGCPLWSVLYLLCLSDTSCPKACDEHRTFLEFVNVFVCYLHYLIIFAFCWFMAVENQFLIEWSAGTSTLLHAFLLVHSAYGFVQKASDAGSPRAQKPAHTRYSEPVLM